MFYNIIEPTMTLLLSLAIISVMYYFVNRWSLKCMKDLEKRRTYVHRSDEETQKEIDFLLSMDEHEKAIS